RAARQLRPALRSLARVTRGHAACHPCGNLALQPAHALGAQRHGPGERPRRDLPVNLGLGEGDPVPHLCHRYETLGHRRASASCWTAESWTERLHRDWAVTFRPCLRADTDGWR